jgi:hypothetical protein
LRPQPRGDARPISGYRRPRRCRNRLRDTLGLEKGPLAQRLSLSGLGRQPLPARPGCVKRNTWTLAGLQPPLSMGRFPTRDNQSHQNHKGCGFLLPSRDQVTNIL